MSVLKGLRQMRQIITSEKTQRVSINSGQLYLIRPKTQEKQRVHVFLPFIVLRCINLKMLLPRFKGQQLSLTIIW
jgi:hypothetical protein